MNDTSNILVSTEKVMSLIKLGDTELLTELLVKMMGADAGLNANIVALNDKLDKLGIQVSKIQPQIDKIIKALNEEK